MTKTNHFGMLVAALAVALAASLLALVAPLAEEARAQEAPPPTLSGEYFTDLDVDVTGTCDPDGTSTIEYEASGTAIGPYPGTFTETGTATIGPQTPILPGTDSNQVSGSVTEFTANFTIDSPAGQVTGTKELSPDSLSRAQCQDDVDIGGSKFDVKQFGVYSVKYTAKIETPDGGRFTDRGRALALVFYPDLEDAPEFAEIFTSSDLTAPEPDLPTTKEQCKKGGFEKFGFENQGDCVSFVATKGKNEPGKKRKQ